MHDDEAKALIKAEITNLENKGVCQVSCLCCRCKTIPRWRLTRVGYSCLRRESVIVKHCVLLGCKESMVSISSVKAESVTLPKAMDTVTDTSQLLAIGHQLTRDSEVHSAPMWSSDIWCWTYSCALVSSVASGGALYSMCRCDGVWFVTLRTAQGNRNGHLIWGRIVAKSS